MRTQSDAAAVVWPFTTEPCTALSFGRMIWHTVPFQVPIARPTGNEMSGASVESVALTAPAVPATNVKVIAPLTPMPPVNVSATAGVGVGEGVIGVVCL